MSKLSAFVLLVTLPLVVCVVLELGPQGSHVTLQNLVCPKQRDGDVVKGIDGHEGRWVYSFRGTQTALVFLPLELSTHFPSPQGGDKRES